MKRIDSVFISVKDLGVSSEWYQNIFDLVVVHLDKYGVGFRFHQPWPLQTGLSLYQSEDTGKASSIQFNFYTLAATACSCWGK
ncbi:VOC family protein [Virgibacillus doumboii]|uniref:VOC family protein n=1 Tax=Virgibacillus doumboii TaxID=2697503 RepID=UPI0013DF3488|nr:hypothetical protein [Virgibacillus doumboii]